MENCQDTKMVSIFWVCLPIKVLPKKQVVKVQETDFSQSEDRVASQNLM